MELTGRVAVVPTADGRVRRRERNREAIIDALFGLVGRGVLQPTAQEVAAAAGVGIRSVFRHFSEIESLHRAMDSRLEAEALRLVTTPRATGALDDRIRGLVRQRAALFERVAPYKRSANLQRWRSSFLQGRHLRMQRLLRDELRAWLPELATTPPPLVEAVDLLTSIEAWERLRVDRRLGAAGAAAVVEGGLWALLGGRSRGAKRP